MAPPPSDVDGSLCLWSYLLHVVDWEARGLDEGASPLL